MGFSAQNIAITGAGIMGLSNAYTLLQAGHNVTIYDPEGFPANNASLVAGGMLAPYSEIEHIDQKWIEAGLQGIRLWHDMLATMGKPVAFKQAGSLFVAHDEDGYILDRFAAHLCEHKNCYRVGKEEIDSLEPQLAERFTSGLYLKEEAHIYPKEAMQALCDYLKERDVKFVLKKAEPDKLQAAFDWVIDCRGMASADNDSDLRGVKGEIVIVRNQEFSLTRPVRLMHPRYPLYIVPRPDHIFMIGATMIESAQGEHVSLRSAMELMSALYSLHSSFGEAHIVELAAGIRPSYADNLPRIKAHGNVVSCNGLFRHGFLFSPFMASCVRNYIEEAEYNSDSDLFIEKIYDYNHKRPTKNIRKSAA